MKKIDKNNISKILLLIVISGIFGFLYEFIFYYFNSGMKVFYYCGGNFLPWINIYAYGAIIIYFLTYKYRKNKLSVFIISLISSGLLELLSGFLIYIIGDGKRYWDYNNEILNFGNIYGFVCLRSVLFFGISGLLLIYVIIPFINKLIDKYKNKMFVISIILSFIFLLDEVYNLIISKIFNLPDAISIYKSIGIPFM